MGTIRLKNDMRTLYRQIICCSLLACLALPALAQTKKDDKGFDATSEAFQRRYRFPDEVPFDTIWKNNISFSVFGGMDKFVPRGDGDFNTGPVLGAALNWRFARFHTLRGAFQYGNFGRKIDNEMLRRFGVQADYLLNVTSFMKGYNPGRLFEISAMAGVGYQFASFLGKNQGAADLHLGAQLKLHPTSQVDFYLEPRVSFLTDGIDHSDQKNWHKYDVTYGAVVGMTYHFKQWTPFGGIKLLDGDDLLDHTFVSVAGGGQFQISKLTNKLGLTKAIGPHVSMSFGKWLIPALGLRLSLFHSADTWHSKLLENGETIYEMSTYIGGRMEGMVNLTHFYNKSDEISPFTINLLAGGEVGNIKKENGYNPAEGGYTGFTGGVQFKYRLFDEMSVFLEPRLTMASFTLKTNKKEQGRYKSEKFTDNLFSLNLGVEFGRAGKEQRLESEIFQEEFVPSFFAGGGIGFGMPLQMKRFRLKNYFDYQAMVMAGYVMTPLSTVRVTGDFGPYSIDLKSGGLKYNLATIGADYLLSLGNLMMGYHPDRKYDAQLLFGLIGSMRMKPSKEIEDEDLKKNRFFLGAEAGLHLSYQLKEPLKVFVEPKIRFYSNEFTKKSSIQWADMMLMMHAGVSYSF